MPPTAICQTRIRAESASTQSIVELAAMTENCVIMVELFPVRIRYTSMSLPYHVGNGVFGGLVPAAGASVAAITGIALSGLLYPMAIAAIGFVVSLTFLREPTHKIRIWDEVGAAHRRSSPTSLS
jgi:hypothetical protein